MIARILRYFRRRRIIRNGENPDRVLTRQERRYMQQRFAKKTRNLQLQ